MRIATSSSASSTTKVLSASDVDDARGPSKYYFFGADGVLFDVLLVRSISVYSGRRDEMSRLKVIVMCDPTIGSFGASSVSWMGDYVGCFSSVQWDSDVSCVRLTSLLGKRLARASPGDRGMSRTSR